MRILHFVSSLAGGGAERQLTYLATGLAGLGVDVHVAYDAGGPNLARLAGSGAVLHRIGSSGNHSLSLFPSICRLIRSVRPDIIQTWLRRMDIAGGTAAAWMRVPWVLSERSSTLAYPFGLKHFARRQLARFASAVVANSEGGAEYWSARLGRGRSISVIPNALPFDEISSVPIPASCDDLPPPPVKLILFAGRFAAERNLESLLAALQKVLSVGGRTAVLCGDGPLRKQVELSIGRLGIRSLVRLPGYVSEHRLWGFMKRADAYVSVSSFEGKPNSTMEAMACRCPLVVSDIPSHREFLKSDSALFVNPNDTAKIAAGLESVLTEVGIARTRAARALEASRQWTIQGMARKYEQVYAVVLRHKGVRQTPLQPSPLG